MNLNDLFKKELTIMEELDKLDTSTCSIPRNERIRQALIGIYKVELKYTHKQIDDLLEAK